jgi:hypothetical protein
LEILEVNFFSENLEMVIKNEKRNKHDYEFEEPR